MLDFDELADQDLADTQDDDYNFAVPVPTAFLKKSGPEKKKKAVKGPPASIGDRQMRVLVLHGRQSNENLVNFQIRPLKTAIGSSADIKVLEADKTWVYQDGVDNHDADPMSVSLSKGLPFRTWFYHSTDDKRDRVDFFKQQDPNVTITYEEPELAVNKLLSYVEDNGPVDVIVTIFEGSLVVHLAIAKLVSEGKPIPWRLSVMFSPLSVRDDKLTAPLIKEKIAHPTVMVFGRIDEYHYYQRTAAGRVPSEDYYAETVVLEHPDGHQLPASQPRAGQIFSRIVEEMQWHCGLSTAAPKKLMAPPKPISMVCKNLEDMSLRKIRVLCMCGGHANNKIIKFQVNDLKAALGKDNIELIFAEGTQEFHWYKGEPKSSAMEERLAGGSPLKNWYNDRLHEPGGVETDYHGYVAHVATDRENSRKQFDPTTDVEYFGIDEAVANHIDFIYREGPFDAIVAFSQGGIFMHLVIAYMRKKAVGGREMYQERWKHARHNQDMLPWGITCFFNCMHVRDKRYMHLFEEPLKGHPTVMVYGTEDEYYEYARDGFGNKSQEEYYEDPVVLVHNQNHEFPTQQPRAKQIYNRVTAEIWRHCGGKPITA